MTKPRKDPRELKAMAYALADEIETKAQRYMRAGLSRTKAINRVITEMAG